MEEIYKIVPIAQLNIHGLNPRQVNAFRKLMESGKMAEFVNQEYFSDMFKHDAITTVPTVVNTGRTHVTHVYYHPDSERASHL